jgi:hypothetical protein
MDRRDDDEIGIEYFPYQRIGAYFEQPFFSGSLLLQANKLNFK